MSKPEPDERKDAPQATTGSDPARDPVVDAPNTSELANDPEWQTMQQAMREFGQQKISIPEAPPLIWRPPTQLSQDTINSEVDTGSIDDILPQTRGRTIALAIGLVAIGMGLGAVIIGPIIRSSTQPSSGSTAPDPSPNLSVHASSAAAETGDHVGQTLPVASTSPSFDVAGIPVTAKSAQPESGQRPQAATPKASPAEKRAPNRSAQAPAPADSSRPPIGRDPY